MRLFAVFLLFSLAFGDQYGQPPKDYSFYNNMYNDLSSLSSQIVQNSNGNQISGQQDQNIQKVTLFWR